MAVDRQIVGSFSPAFLDHIDPLISQHRTFLENNPLFKYSMSLETVIPRIVEEGKELQEALQQPWEGEKTVNAIAGELADIWIFNVVCFGSQVGIDSFKQALEQEMSAPTPSLKPERRGKRALHTSQVIVQEAEDIQRLADWEKVRPSDTALVDLAIQKLAKIAATTYTIADMYHIDLTKKIEEKIQYNEDRFGSVLFQNLPPNHGLTPKQAYVLGYALHKLLNEQTRDLQWFEQQLTEADITSDNFSDLVPQI